MPEIFVGIGSNVERERHTASALRDLEARFGSLRVSSIYESEAVGFEGDPFYNLVVGFQSELPVEEIAGFLAEMEVRHGRTRESKKFAPRTLDLDLILYGEGIIQSGKLKLPREDLTRYAFMLEPLAELAPDLVHPVLGKTIAELWAAFDKGQSRQHRIEPGPAGDGEASVYGFATRTLSGETLDLADFRGKVLLIVNTASRCGFTPQYAGLEKLHETYSPRGLVVIGFPCDQFGGQEPGSAEEIQSFCQKNYGVSFPLSEKVEVNGPKAHPLFRYLTQSRPGLLGIAAIKWNFTKFLVDRSGQVVERFAPTTAPEALAGPIESLLSSV